MTADKSLAAPSVNSRNRNMHRSFLGTIVAAAAALATSGTVLAAGEIHPAPAEKGYTSHPDHKASAPKTRAQVKAELAAAQKDGSAARIARGLPLPAETKGMNKTRGQVTQEMKNETAEEKRKRLADLKGN